MISYGNPICPITQNRATLFCYEAKCPRPAFACSHECFIEEGHSNHKTALWSAIEGRVWEALELSLAKQELLILERQEKQFKIICEEIKNIQHTYEKSIAQSKKRLQVKETAKRIIEAVQNKTTDSITGDDMASLINAIKSGGLFQNKKIIDKESLKQNNLISQLATRINMMIYEYKTRLMCLPRQQSIPNDGLILQSRFTVDTPNSKSAVVINGITSVQIQDEGHYCPIFACEPLNRGCSFEVIVIDAVDGLFMIGVATSSLRNENDKHISRKSMCVFSFGYLYSEQNQYICNFKIKTGNIVQVRRGVDYIEWVCQGQQLCIAPIPKQIRQGELFPVLWIRSYKEQKHISKLRFM